MKRRKDGSASDTDPVDDDGVEAEPDSDLDMILSPANTDTDEPEVAEAADVPESLTEHEEAVARRAGRSKARPQRDMVRSPERSPAPRAAAMAPPPPVRGPRVVYWVAALASALWVALLAAFFVGYARDVEPFNVEPVALAVGGVLSIGVLLIFWVLAFLAAQGAKLSAQSRYVHAKADEMMHPALMAAGDTRGAVELVRVEIEGAVAAASQARHELVTLREVLADETARLIEATASAARTAAALTESIGKERVSLETLSGRMAEQTWAVEQAITSQAKMVAEAADLAETQIREAEAALAARASDLAAAAGDAVDAAKTAGDSLSTQASRLEAAGSVVSEQVRIAEDTLTEQRASMVQVAHQLRAEQEDFAAQVESQQAQLSEILIQMRTNAAELGASADDGAQALKSLIETSAAQFREVADAAAEERDLVGAEAMRSIGALSESARRERETMQAEAEDTIDALARAAADAKAAAESQADIARQRIEQLGEAAFAAGQQADKVFDARLNEARALVDQSVELVEEAGRKTGERLVEGLEAATATIGQLEKLLSDLDERARQLPADAQARSAEITTALEKGVENLLEAARKAADETDAAFQDRVRRNYEMLSESVRLMGVVSGAGSSRAPRAPRPEFSPRSTAPAPAPAAPALQAPPPTPTAPPSEVDADTDAERPRLRLRPAASEPDALFDPDPEAIPPAEAVAAQRAEEGWTWRELLGSIDGQAADAAQPDLLLEIRELGIDSAALLPSGRIAEIAAVLGAGDQVGAREIVRASAPAAMRRLSRRVLTDTSTRSRVREFATRFETRIDETAAGASPAQGLTALLSAEEGRAYLLLDAAVGDL